MLLFRFLVCFLFFFLPPFSKGTGALFVLFAPVSETFQFGFIKAEAEPVPDRKARLTSAGWKSETSQYETAAGTGQPSAVVLSRAVHFCRTTGAHVMKTSVLLAPPMSLCV